MTPHDSLSLWEPMDPSVMGEVADARLQMHHAAQFASAFGISLLAHASDDSHTSLTWDARHGALTSGHAPGTDVAVALGVADLTVLVVVGTRVHTTLPLIGRTIDEVATELRAALDVAGVDSLRYTLRRHFEIPDHPVAHGARFSATPAHCAQLAHMFAAGDLLLGEIARSTDGGTTVRCWPHHFDIATLLTFPNGRSNSVGLAAGDHFYEAPYAYVNVHPATENASRAEPLAGGGSWHTQYWVGAVLPLTQLTANAGAQETQLRAFYVSAVAACERLVTR